MRLTIIIGLILVTLGLTAVRAKPDYSSVQIEGVPHVVQKPDFCGEACAEMVLRKLGYPISQDEVFARSGLDPALGRGLYTPELKKALENTGFDPGQVWTRIEVKQADKQLEAQFADLHKDLQDGIPSIVCMRFNEDPDTTEHFRLVLGYDHKRDQVIYHEPAFSNGAYKRMSRERFLDLWPLKYRKDSWTLVRLRMKPDDIEAMKKEPGFSPADFAQHVMKLKKIVPAGFHIVIQSPFVVIGDESAVMVKARAHRTVKWAADRLKEAYFKKDPGHIIDIWLFRDEESYRKHTRSIFNENPGTPFGYYSETNRALIMNIATGGGTLVHEIVHPFVKSNFPGCPSWLNEGLGSLYEQCGEREGEIKGFTNWRLAGLQQAIRDGEVPPFEDLLSTSEHEFYNEDPGTNYAQARYLCYYLQEQGLLFNFYHEFFKNRDDDPTGIKTLKKVLQTDDLEAFQKKWEAYVLKLSFP